MYKFHFDNIKNKYGKNSRLLFTDIGSLMHEIKREDLYEDFSKDKEMFDFSNYLTKSKYNKRNDKRFNNRGYSLFFLMGIFLEPCDWFQIY